jgi:hypothetical protein
MRAAPWESIGFHLQWEQAKVQYEQVVLAALREVSDALTATSLAQEMTGIEGGQRDSNPRFGLER